MKSSLEQLLSSSKFDELAAKAIALELASARYNALSSEKYETARIRYILEHTEMTDKLDIDLLRSVTSAILVQPDGSVSIKLKNGQILEGGETAWQN